MKNLNIVAKIISKTVYPMGSKDNGGRWYPSKIEKASCCENVRSPSRQWPWSLWEHCRTQKHVRTRLTEWHTEVEKKALEMTVEEAPLYLSDKNRLLQEVARKLIGYE